MIQSSPLEGFGVALVVAVAGVASAVVVVVVVGVASVFLYPSALLVATLVVAQS